ncbi:MAG: proline dehydrogenase family protein [Candidatus Omnitrophota bacterium]|nr:proline dehydrogenase family protein [Candidatus Omnitrophota bacterium]
MPSSNPLPIGMSQENQIQTVGRKVLELARREEVKFAKKHRWENALLDWCMANEELKNRTFRFIDVFPQLKSSKSVLQHIREYFPLSEHRLPQAIRAGLVLTHPGLLTRGAVHGVTHAMFMKLSKFFVAAANEKDLEKILDDLDREGVTSSIDLLGEKTMSEAEAEICFQRYQSLIRTLGKKKWGFKKQNVSVKLSALDPLFDPIDPNGTSERIRWRLRELVRLGTEQQVFIHIDMEEFEMRDLTLKIVRDLLHEDEFAPGIALGIVLQAYLRDAEDCLDGILSWAKTLAKPLTIRLVRGAYWDQEIMKAKERSWPIPVFLRKDETDAMFEKLTVRILDEAPHVNLALATHNVRSIAHAITCAKAKGIGDENLEFQLLYGMGEPLMHVLREMNYAPRMYTPIGDPVWGMAYLVRRLLENVSSQSFVRRSVHDESAVGELLRAPLAMIDQNDTEGPPEKNNHYHPCPSLRFFNHKIRQDFSDNLEEVILTLRNPKLPIVVNGKSKQKKVRTQIISPIDGVTKVASASNADASDVDQAIRVSLDKFRSWANTPVHVRANYLRRTAEWMRDHRYEMAALEVLEVGKPYREADADVKEAIDFLNYYAYSAEKLMQDHPTETLADEVNFTRPRPRGVTAVIAPWNFPIAILTGMSAAALVTGNPVLLKPAEQSPLTAWKVFEAFREAGVPPGVLHYLSGVGEEIGSLMADDPRVSVVAFTGSREVGLQIVARSNLRNPLQRHVKKTVIEMGGKNAAIVDETADFDQAIPDILYSAFGYAGQKCSALSRLIVLDDVYDAFIKRLIQAAGSFPVGDPADPRTLCGPVIDEQARQRILSAIEEATVKGKVLFKADVSNLAAGYYVPPAIIADLPANSRLLRDELFGPILAVIRAKNFEEALNLANDSDFALTGGLFSRTPSHIERAKQEFECGNFYVNRPTTGAIVQRQPFGGYNLSGTGTKAGSAEYLREFFIERTISENVSRHGFAPLNL